MNLKRYTLTNLNERPLYPSNFRRHRRSRIWDWVFTVLAAVSTLYGLFTYIKTL